MNASSYIHGDSFYHRFDVRPKLISTLLFAAIAFAMRSWVGLDASSPHSAQRGDHKGTAGIPYAVQRSACRLDGPAVHPAPGTALLGNPRFDVAQAR